MKIIRGKQPGAKKVVIYGPEGIGKSTFAAQFPDPVFIDTEGSTKDMDVARFEEASSWQMLTDQVRYVIGNPSVCKTLVVDTADWAEQMCIQDMCDRDGKKGIEDYGYGNGYVYAKEAFGKFLNLLSDVIKVGVHVVITAHAQIRKFEQPDEMGAYDRYELKLGKKTQSQTSPLLKEWADMVLFANYKTMSIAVDDKGKKYKAQGGKRVMHTSHHPCWDAKNRYGLPEEVPFEYGSIAHIIEGTAPAAEEPPKHTEPAINRPERSEPEPALTDNGQQMSLPLSEPPMQGVLENNKSSAFYVDEKIPKALRDLMIANTVQEEELQTVIEAEGYVPVGTPIYQYNEVNPGIVEGLLVAQWEGVYRAVKEMREKQEIPFH